MKAWFCEHVRSLVVADNHESLHRHHTADEIRKLAGLAVEEGQRRMSDVGISCLNSCQYMEIDDDVMLCRCRLGFSTDSQYVVDLSYEGLLALSPSRSCGPPSDLLESTEARSSDFLAGPAVRMRLLCLRSITSYLAWRRLSIFVHAKTLK